MGKRGPQVGAQPDAEKGYYKVPQRHWSGKQMLVTKLVTHEYAAEHGFEPATEKNEISGGSMPQESRMTHKHPMVDESRSNIAHPVTEVHENDTDLSEHLDELARREERKYGPVETKQKPWFDKIGLEPEFDKRIKLSNGRFVSADIFEHKNLGKLYIIDSELGKYIFHAPKYKITEYFNRRDAANKFAEEFANSKLKEEVTQKTFNFIQKAYLFYNSAISSKIDATYQSGENTVEIHGDNDNYTVKVNNEEIISTDDKEEALSRYYRQIEKLSKHSSDNEDISLDILSDKVVKINRDALSKLATLGEPQTKSLILKRIESLIKYEPQSGIIHGVQESDEINQGVQETGNKPSKLKPSKFIYIEADAQEGYRQSDVENKEPFFKELNEEAALKIAQKLNINFDNISLSQFCSKLNEALKLNPDEDIFSVARKIEKGGEGSGNFNHLGRPGEIGGSLNLEFKLPDRVKQAGDKLVDIKVIKLDDYWATTDEDYYVDENGAGGNKYKYNKFLDFLKEGIPIEAAEVTISERGKVSFINGRHRFAVLRDLGIKMMPIALDDKSIENAKKFNLLANDKLEKEAGMTPYIPEEFAGNHELEQPYKVKHGTALHEEKQEPIKIEKERRYLGISEKPPEGYFEHTGKRGGRYYDTEERTSNKPEDTVEVTSNVNDLIKQKFNFKAVKIDKFTPQEQQVIYNAVEKAQKIIGKNFSNIRYFGQLDDEVKDDLITEETHREEIENLTDCIYSSTVTSFFGRPSDMESIAGKPIEEQIDKVYELNNNPGHLIIKKEVIDNVCSKKYIAAIRKMESRIHHLYGRAVELEDVVIHELGHAIQWDKDVVDLKKCVELFRKYNLDKFTKFIWGKTARIMTEREFSQDRYKIISEISEYAGTSLSEFIAEAFVMKVHGILPDIFKGMFKI